MSPLSDLPDLIRQVTRPGLFWGIARIGEEGRLFPEEAAHVARAVPARRAEFLAGRIAARRALAQLGYKTPPLPAGPDRAPLWPAGVSGSISHSAGAAIAVVGDSTRHPLLGVDIEPAEPLPVALIVEICRPEEIADRPAGDRPMLARRLFSAKEALYKAQYPRSRTVFGFHGLTVDLHSGEARFPPHPETAGFAPDSRQALRLAQTAGPRLILSLGLAPD